MYYSDGESSAFAPGGQEELDGSVVLDENVTLTTGQSAAEVRRTLIAINDRLREWAGQAVLLVYNSGHPNAGPCTWAAPSLRPATSNSWSAAARPRCGS